MFTTLISYIIVIGTFQGIITSILLVFKAHKKLNDYLLVSLLSGFSIIGINILITDFIPLNFQCIKFPPLSIELFMPPLFFWFVSSVTIQKQKITLNDILLFIPGIVIYSVILFYFIILQNSTTDKILENYYFIRKIEDILLPIFWIIILYLSFQNLNKYKNWLKNNISDTSRPMYNFLKHSIILLTISNLIYAVNLTLDFSINFCHISYMHWQIYYIAAAIIIYYIGFMGYKMPAIKVNPIPFSDHLDSKNGLSINDSEAERIKFEIVNTIEAKRLYTNPELDLNTLSSQLGISQLLLSQIINKNFNTNFRSFINNYRIEEVKKKLISDKYKEYSIIGIAFESGFNSEASFYRIFKNKTGISPLDFRKSTLKT